MSTHMKTMDMMMQLKTDLLEGVCILAVPAFISTALEMLMMVLDAVHWVCVVEASKEETSPTGPVQSDICPCDYLQER